MVRIGGMGIAGLMAASVLASEGTEVVIFEKNMSLLPLRPLVMREENFRFLEKKIPSKIFSVLKPVKNIYKIEKVSPSGKSEVFESKKPLFRVFERGKGPLSVESRFLKFLDGKIDIRLGKFVSSKEVDILSTGFVSPNIFGYGKIYESDLNHIIMYYNNDIAKYGYTCAIPFSKGRIYILSVHFSPINFSVERKLFEKTVQIPCFFNLGLEKPLEEVFGMENYFYPPVLKSNGALVCGSAGGFVDATRGFGFYYALITGYLAASSFINKKNYEDAVQYLKERLKKEHQKRARINQFTNRDYESMIEKMSSKERYVSISKHMV